MLKLPDHLITLRDIKTLEYGIRRCEESAIKADNSQFKAGYTNDAIINAFMWRLSSPRVHCVSSLWASILVKPFENTSHKRILEALKRQNWENVELVILPIHLNLKSHWQLGLITGLQTEEISFARK